MKIDYAGSEKFVEKQIKRGNDVRWDGWNMTFFSAHRGGFFGGVYRNGQYGFETVVSPDEKGYWNIPPKVTV